MEHLPIFQSGPGDPNSANYINFIGFTVTLHADFGTLITRRWNSIKLSQDHRPRSRSRKGPSSMKATPVHFRFHRMRLSKGIRSPAMVIAMFWCLRKMDAGFTNFTTPTLKAGNGALTPPTFGT